MWTFGNNTNLIFNGYDASDGYQVQVSANLPAAEFNLTLSSLDASYAGCYICLEPGTSQQASALLTVLGIYTVNHKKGGSTFVIITL